MFKFVRLSRFTLFKNKNKHLMCMKKLIFSTILAIILLSCNKNDKTTSQESSSNEMIQDSTIVSPTSSIKELNQSQLTAQLTNKENDTLYITNFFATWCGPCKKEIPDFKEQMKKLEGKPVKFTFISVDAREDWDTELPKFIKEYGLENHVQTFDASLVSDDFFKSITKTWDGGSIPFTLFQKGNQSAESVGMLTKEELETKISQFK